MAGSLVCALAPNMVVLILGRVLHGLGGGGLTSTGMVVLGDVAAPQGPRQILRLFLGGLHHRRRLRTGARRLHRRISALVGDLLDEHPARPPRGRDDVHAAARPAAARPAAPARFPRRRADHGGELVVHAGAQHGRRELSVDCRRRSWRCSPQRLLLGIGFRRAAAHRARTAHSAVDPVEPRGAAAPSPPTRSAGARSSG